MTKPKFSLAAERTVADPGATRISGNYKRSKHEAYEERREWVGLEKGETWPTDAPALELINNELKGFYQSP